jgi:hypothetical protein
VKGPVVGRVEVENNRQEEEECCQHEAISE